MSVVDTTDGLERAGRFSVRSIPSLLSWLQPLGVIGLILVVAWTALAILAPVIAPYNPLSQNAPLLIPPSAQHILGTDELGRDILSRVIWGARVSLPLAVVLVTGTIIIGATLGGLSGYFGGLVDGIVMRVADLFFAFPVILLAMTVAAALGPGLRNAVLAVMCVAWPNYARIIRGLIRSLSEADYVSATRLLGASTPRALIKDLLPNVAGPIIALATLNVGTAVLLLSALSFLGLGAQAPTSEWGSMVAIGTEHPDKWWLSLYPGLAILSVVLGFTFLGDRLRDALDPKSSWSGGGKGR